MNSTSTALQVVEGGAALPAERPVGLLRPVAAPAAVIQAQNETRTMVSEALQKGRDYGVIPGTDKPTLLKPGAERLTLAFGLTPRFHVVEREIDHDRTVEWVKRKKGGEYTGTSRGLYRYVVECELVHRETGVTIASCLGVCSTMESRYVDRPRDVENTVAKMAEKRALVGATLLALGLSDQFTQDVEDLAADGALPERGAAADAPQTGGTGGTGAGDEPEATCPKCQGAMWDNRKTKTNPKAPDFKCRDKSCDGVYWPGQWPPKGPDPRQTDAFAANDAAAAEPITGDTPWPSGTHAGTKISALPDAVLRWAIEPGRKLGDRTADLQAACELELESRSERRTATPPGDPTDLPF